MRRTLILLTIVAVALSALAAPAGARPNTTSVARVTVSMTDYKFKLSKSRVGRGVVFFQVVNDGEIVHDFKIAGKKTPIYEKGQGGILRVTFTKAGRYRYICTVPGHALAGMKGIFTVK